MTKAEFQRLRSLREKKHREALGLFVVEGEKVVAELLAAGFAFEQIYATEQWPGDRAGVGALPQTHSVKGQVEPTATLITAAEMARISHFPTPSSVFAIGKLRRAPLPPQALESGLTLALDGVQDAGNVGTLLRIADWFAFDRVVLSPDCADLFHQKVINASMGSFARVRAHTADLAKTLGELRDRRPGVPVLGCDLEGEDVHTLAPLKAGVVVIGSEGRGLSAPVAAQLTRRITIPRYGTAESLNAAVAAGIICDQLRRRPT